MSKRRRSKKSPNLPKATLRRAREQLEGDDEEEEEEEPSEPEQVEEEPRRRRRRERNVSRPSAQPETIRYSKRRSKDGLDHEAIERMLAHPTHYVSEEELREEYSYVLSDLRNMAVLAGALFVVLIILAQFI